MLSFLLSLRYEAVPGRDAGVQGWASLCVLASRIGLNGPETQDLDPAVGARHDRYDVEGIHSVAVPTGSSVGDAPYGGVARTGPVTNAHHNQFFEFIVGSRGTHGLRTMRSAALLGTGGARC